MIQSNLLINLLTFGRINGVTSYNPAGKRYHHSSEITIVDYYHTNNSWNSDPRTEMDPAFCIDNEASDAPNNLQFMRQDVLYFRVLYLTSSLSCTI